MMTTLMMSWRMEKTTRRKSWKMMAPPLPLAQRRRGETSPRKERTIHPPARSGRKRRVRNARKPEMLLTMMTTSVILRLIPLARSREPPPMTTPLLLRWLPRTTRRRPKPVRSFTRMTMKSRKRSKLRPMTRTTKISAMRFRLPVTRRRNMSRILVVAVAARRNGSERPTTAILPAARRRRVLLSQKQSGRKSKPLPVRARRSTPKLLNNDTLTNVRIFSSLSCES